MRTTSRERVVQNAEKYVSRGKIEAAIKEYRKLLADNPNDISTLNRVGDLYARIDRNGEAIELFTQIAKQYAADGFFVKSIAIYKKIIKLDPTLLEVYEQLADLYHRQGLVNEARTQYQVLADYYLKHERSGQAISIYRRMAELEPDDPSHHVKLAELYQQEDRTGEAMGEYRAIADLMLGHGRGVEAARVYQRALDVDPSDLGFVTDAVLKLKEGGHVAAAASFLSHAVERNPQAERVAKIAGLGDRPPSSRPADAPREAGPDAVAEATPDAAEPARAVPEPAPPAARAPDDALEERPTLGAEASPDPAADLAEPSGEGLGGGFDLGELEPNLFEIDLDDDDSSSLVTPPADMLEDHGRRGAAWTEPVTEAGSGPAGAEAPADPEDDLSATGSFEVDLEPLETAASGGPEIDHDLLERTAAEVHAGADSDEIEDLLTEAEVLARYGIEQKALERLAELLQREPENLAGYALMVNLHFEAGRHERVVAVAGRMAEVASALGDDTVWPDVRERLLDGGYRVEGDVVEPPLGADLAAAEPAEPPVPPPEPAAVLQDSEPALGEITEADLELDLDSDLLSPDALPEVELEPVPESAHEEAPGWELADVAEERPPAEEPPPPAAPPVEEPPALDEPPAEDEPPDEKEPAVEEPPEPPHGDEAPAATPPRKRRDVESILAQLSGQFLGRRKSPRSAEPAAPETPESEQPTATAPPPSTPSAPVGRPGAGMDPLRALGDSLRAEIDDGTGAPSGIPPAVPPADATPAPAALDETGVSWLDEVAAGPADDAFADDADFFDLGAELEQELSAEEGMDEDLVVMESGEQSLEDIVEGFKRGVAENLSPEDFDTHYNLGIAYREMGLLDEAIGEFQLAARDAGYLVPCASMLGLCFTEKGLPELAVKWYRRGLDAPGISDDDRAGLLYDLGEALVAAGDRMAAYHTFVDLYGINTNYRDVVARLAELEPAR